MNEPREPRRPEDPGISLPSWVDDAIVKSGGSPSAETNPGTDVGPAAEMAVNPPPDEPAPSPSPSPPPSNAIPPELVSEQPTSVDTPEEARKAAGLPWLGLALLFLAAALVIGYLMLTRVPKH